jgi:hypothetical protein
MRQSFPLLRARRASPFWGSCVPPNPADCLDPPGRYRDVPSARQSHASLAPETAFRGCLVLRHEVRGHQQRSCGWSGVRRPQSRMAASAAPLGYRIFGCRSSPQSRRAAGVGDVAFPRSDSCGKPRMRFTPQRASLSAAPDRALLGFPGYRLGLAAGANSCPPVARYCVGDVGGECRDRALDLRGVGAR